MDIWEQFERNGIKPSDDWSSIILVRVFPQGTFAHESTTRTAPIGYIFVIEPKREDPKLKLPGGHKQPGENPLETAIRELRGEAGVAVSPDSVRYVNAHWRDMPSPHWSCLFLAHVEESEIHWMNSGDIENEGEVPRFRTAAEFQQDISEGGFLHWHLQRLRDAGFTA